MMSILLLCSASGSPGVTVTSLGLALAWPRDVVLADCDPHPAQPIQAGWLAGVDCTPVGLSSVTSFHRSGADLRDELSNQTVVLAPGTPERRFLPGFSHAGAPQVFEAVWPDLAAAFDDLGRGGVDVLVDAGRVGARGLPEALVSVADAVGVVTRSTLKSLAALRLYLPIVAEQVSAVGVRAELGLVLVGESMPYSGREIAAQFDAPIQASLAWDPRSADRLDTGITSGRTGKEGRLTRQFVTTARSWSARIEQRRAALAHEPEVTS